MNNVWMNKWFEGSESLLGSSSWGFLSGWYFVLGVACVSVIMCGLSLTICERSRWNKDQKVAFECGFDPLSSVRTPFSLPFFLVALLFLIFDVEVVLLLCVCYSLKSSFFSLSLLSLFMCALFCLVLLLGLAHEMNEGSLDWRH
uniref:NADH-ubiquinone oxidoreductase chain 3 n=1 Tax=Raeta pulchella TaxID=2109557 RepID=A0AA50AEJ0_9BIVA|nr:NADH dehydrogenase subunit 3 [Raeta pulchella]WLK25954.1 NADH dehydrogenase subunit 3 [Raeta pulchella]